VPSVIPWTCPPRHDSVDFLVGFCRPPAPSFGPSRWFLDPEADLRPWAPFLTRLNSIPFWPRWRNFSRLLAFGRPFSPSRFLSARRSVRSVFLFPLLRSPMAADIGGFDLACGPPFHVRFTSVFLISYGFFRPSALPDIRPLKTGDVAGACVFFGWRSSS